MTDSFTVTEFSSGAILVGLLQWLRKLLPFLDGLDGWILRILSIIWAIVSTFTVSYEYHEPLVGGTIALLITIWHIVSQFSIQEVVYRAVKQPSMDEVLERTTAPAKATK